MIVGYLFVGVVTGLIGVLCSIGAAHDLWVTVLAGYLSALIGFIAAVLAAQGEPD